jgi:hypothetical protein
MFFTGTDNFEGDGASATFHAVIKSGTNGKQWVRVYATSGCVDQVPYICRYNYTTSGNGWFQPAALATNPAAGLLGIPSGAIASGCVGWLQVRGACTCTGAAASFTGSIGHAVYWGGATGLGATGSAYVGAQHQVGFLLDEYGGGGTNVADIFLTGNAYAQSL